MVHNHAPACCEAVPTLNLNLNLNLLPFIRIKIRIKIKIRRGDQKPRKNLWREPGLCAMFDQLPFL